MSPLVNRRSVVKTGAVLGASLGLWNRAGSLLAAAEAPKGTPHAEQLGWRVACCAYTYRGLPLFESIQKTAEFGLRYLEGYNWQMLGKDNKIKVDESMPAELRTELKKRLKDAGVQMVSCYVSGLPGQEVACRKRFEFFKDLGLETFVSEPPPQQLDLIEKLCNEYQMNLAIHNHPKPSSRYWNPDTVLEVCKGRSKRIGCCADTGHWLRSGLQPAQELKKLEGRVITFHLKDLKAGGNADCAWGTGRGDIEGILKEMHRQKAKVVFGIEYESADFAKAIRECIAYMEKVASTLGA